MNYILYEPYSYLYQIEIKGNLKNGCYAGGLYFFDNEVYFNKDNSFLSNFANLSSFFSKDVPKYISIPLTDIDAYGKKNIDGLYRLYIKTTGSYQYIFNVDPKNIDKWLEEIKQRIPNRS